MFYDFLSEYIFMWISQNWFCQNTESTGFSALDLLKSWTVVGSSSRLIHNELQIMLLMMFLLYNLCFKYFTAENILQLVTFFSFQIKVNGSYGEISPRKNITILLYLRKELLAFLR